MARRAILTAVAATLSATGLGLVAVVETRAGLLPAPARTPAMGPPIMCFPIDIGDAKSLPWGASGDAFSTRGGYSKASLVQDTLTLLKTAESPLTRMETLRRAVAYIDRDKAMATELLAKLAWIALDAEAGGESPWRATAWLDAGFLAVCLDEMSVPIGWEPGVSDGVTGYAWLKKAIAYAPDNAVFQYAAALAVHPARSKGTQETYRSHLDRARAGAPKGSLLAANIERHERTWGAER